MFEVIGSEGLLIPSGSFEAGLTSLIEEYRRLRSQSSGKGVVLSDRMERYWKSLGGSYEEAMPYWVRFSRSQSQKKKKRHPFWLHLGIAVRRWRSDPLRLWLVPIYLRDALRNTFGPPAAAGHYAGRFYIMREMPSALARKVARYSRAHRDSLIAYYDKLAKAPDFSQPYVYVALHAQPERSTNPMGGVFDEQDIMIKLIASTLPAGWRVYVKEHPSQFLDFSSERGRWHNCYDSMLSHPAVLLVPRDTPAFDLIDNAKAVASLVGSSCWEAVVRGIPALLFGEAWYKGCDGVHTVRTNEDCRNAIARIAAGERPDPDAVRLFLSVAEKSSAEAYLNDEDRVIARIDEETNVDRLAGLIETFYRSVALSPAGAEPRKSSAGAAEPFSLKAV
jgi:hypothetical protein